MLMKTQIKVQMRMRKKNLLERWPRNQRHWPNPKLLKMKKVRKNPLQEERRQLRVSCIRKRDKG